MLHLFRHRHGGGGGPGPGPIEALTRLYPKIAGLREISNQFSDLVISAGDMPALAVYMLCGQQYIVARVPGWASPSSNLKLCNLMIAMTMLSPRP